MSNLGLYYGQINCSLQFTSPITAKDGKTLCRECWIIVMKKILKLVNILFVLSRSVHEEIVTLLSPDNNMWDNIRNITPDQLNCKTYSLYSGSVSFYLGVYQKIADFISKSTISLNSGSDLSEIGIGVYTFYSHKDLKFISTELSDEEKSLFKLSHAGLSVALKSKSWPDKFVNGVISENGEVSSEISINYPDALKGAFKYYLGTSHRLIVFSDCREDVYQRWGYLLEEAYSTANEILVIDILPFVEVLRADETTQKNIKQAMAGFDTLVSDIEWKLHLINK